LIELMIVVAIIAILAAVAFPAFAKYQMQAKSSEAKICLNSIALAQLSYHGETNQFVACAPNPPAVPGTTRALWVGVNADFDPIGFMPKDRRVYYQYGSTSANAAMDFTATATGDLDGDGNLAVFQIQNNTPFTGPAIAGTY
jgi:type II secretory pathway pseudopilin PulG